MPDRQKSYVGVIEHDELSFKPRAFASFLAGHSGWQISQALDVQFPKGRETATVKLTKTYGQGSAELQITASDSGTYSGRGGGLVQRVTLSATFDDPMDWQARASEELVAGTMRQMDEAILKLTTYDRIWQRTAGYWRCGSALYQCPDTPHAESGAASPQSSPPRPEGGVAGAGNRAGQQQAPQAQQSEEERKKKNRRITTAAVSGGIGLLSYNAHPDVSLVLFLIAGFFLLGGKTADQLLDALLQKSQKSQTPDKPSS
jgi:hypothetical protein